MAVGRISGPLLKPNLIRNGIDLAFDTDLLYLDVNNKRIGINTSNPQYALDVSGTTRTTNLVVTSGVDIADVNINGNTIQTSKNELVLGTADNVVYQKKAIVDGLKFDGDTISTIDSNANLNFRPNGVGAININSNLNVTGNIHATGNISADGDIVLGDADTDTITFNADIASNLTPNATTSFDIGSVSKRWRNAYVKNFNADSVTTSSLALSGIPDITQAPGNTIYVAENGADSNIGIHPQDPYGSITKALSVAVSGDMIYINAGTYTEAFPMTVPVGVTVRGASLRSVTIKPTTATETKDAFLLNGESTVEDVTIMDFYSGYDRFTVTSGGGSTGTVVVTLATAPQAHAYVSGGVLNDTSFSSEVSATGATYNNATGELTITYSGTVPTAGTAIMLKGFVFSCSGTNKTYPNNGYAFRFATGYTVTSRSPYIRNITVITKGRTVSASDPRGYFSGDAGKGALVDGSYAETASKEASMLFHSVTFITPGVNGLSCTNGARVEWLNCFTYFAKRSIYAFDSGIGKKSDGKTRIRLGGVSGTFSAGNTVTFTSRDASTVVSVTAESVDGDILVVDGKNTNLIGFDTSPQSISNGSGATATTILNVDVKDFGAEIRTIASASVYGEQGLVGDGPGVLVYAIGHNVAYVGSNEQVTNDPTLTVQGNEVVTTNDAKIRFSSVDHKGDFRVGDLFHVNQETGAVNFAGNTLNIDLSAGAIFTDGVNTTEISGSKIDTGNLRLTGNTLSTTAGDLQLDAASGQIVLQDNVQIQGSLDVTGNVTIGGDIQLGDTSSVDIAIIARINSSLIPNTNSTHSLGDNSLRWNNLHIDEVQVDDININTNRITTTNSNANLELTANGTGKVTVPNNTLEITNDLIVNGTSTFQAVNINGNATINGSITQTGNTTVNGNATVNGTLSTNANVQLEDILISGNFITTTASNSPLELKASGTGVIGIPSNNVLITKDLQINGTITANNFQTSSTITGNEFATTDILIKDNYITTTTSNSDLDLRASGSGSVVVEDLSINGSTISSDTTITLSPAGESIIVNGTGSVTLAKGTTAQRDNSAGAGQVRYNTDLNKFEGYDGSNWYNLTGLQDLDGNTKITPELTPGANDNIIRFYVGGSVVGTIDSTKFEVPQVQVDDININGNVISTTTTDTDLQFSANGTGQVKFENFGISGGTITNTVTDSLTTFQNTGTGYVQFQGTLGVVLPVGDTGSRGANATGMIRYNTDDTRVELYDGTSWTSVAGSAGGINFGQAKELAIEMALIAG